MLFQKIVLSLSCNIDHISIMNKNQENKKTPFFQKILEDKRAIRKCIQEGGDVKKLAKERGIKFATPL